MHDTARALSVVALLGAAGLVLPAPAAGQPNGWSAQSIVAGGSRLDSLAVIDMATGETARFQAPPGVLVDRGELTPDGRYFLLPTSIGLVRFHTAPPALDRIIGPSLPITAIAVAPTGTTVHVTGAFGRGTLDWESGETLSAQCCAAPLISFTPDGSVRFEVQPGPESTLTAVAGPTGTVLWSLVVPGRAGRAALSGTSAAVAVSAAPGVSSTIVFDLTDGAERGRLPWSEGPAWAGSNLILSRVIDGPTPEEKIGRLSSFDEDTLTETVVSEMPGELSRSRPTAVRVSADSRHAYWLWHWSLLGLTVSGTDYRVIDLSAGLMVSSGTMGPQFQTALALEAAPHCLFSVPGSVSAPAEGGVIGIPVQPGPGCRPWSVDGEAILNPGPHDGAATILMQVWPNQTSQDQATSPFIAGQRVSLLQAAGAPSAPTVSAEVDAGRVRLTWTPGVGAGILGFTVSGAVAGGTLAPVASLPASSRQWVSPPLPPGSYAVEVAASNSAGGGPASNRVTFSVGVTSLADAPSGLSATGIDDQFTLFWEPAPSVPAAEGFVIEGAADGDGTFVEVARTSSPSLYLTGVPVGAWQVRVRARTAGGVGAPSAPIGVSSSACSAPPSRPLMPWSIPTAGQFVIGQPAVPASYTVQWSAPATGSVNEYVLEAGTTSGASDLATLVLRGDERSTTQVLTGVRAFVRIRARNACGVSAPSDEVLVLAH